MVKVKHINQSSISPTYNCNGCRCSSPDLFIVNNVLCLCSKCIGQLHLATSPLQLLVISGIDTKS